VTDDPSWDQRQPRKVSLSRCLLDGEAYPRDDHGRWTDKPGGEGTGDTKEKPKVFGKRAKAAITPPPRGRARLGVEAALGGAKVPVRRLTRGREGHGGLYPPDGEACAMKVEAAEARAVHPVENVRGRHMLGTGITDLTSPVSL